MNPCVRGNPVSVIKNLDDGIGFANLDFLANETERHRVKVAVNTDMVIELDCEVAPCGAFVSSPGQWQKERFLFQVEQSFSTALLLLKGLFVVFQQLSSDENDAIINEFYQMCIAQKAITEGGLDYASAVLTKAFGDKKASELIFRATNKMDSSAFSFVKDLDNKNLLMILKNEHPQTIAVILSHTTPDKVSQMLAGFERDEQIDIIERISNLERANPDVIGIVEKIMKKETSLLNKSNLMENGGAAYIAEIMNRVDRESQKEILESLSETNPSLSDEIRKLMFVFNDIVNLNDMEIQAFVRVVDTKDLTISLKAASQEVQDRIFNNMSSRQRESIQSDMQYLRNLRKRDVEAAQQRVIDAIRGLEESGDIVLFKGGGDEIIA